MKNKLINALRLFVVSTAILFSISGTAAMLLNANGNPLSKGLNFAVFSAFFGSFGIAMASLLTSALASNVKSKGARFFTASFIGLFFGSYGMMLWPLVLSTALLSALYFAFAMEPENEK